MDQSDKSAYAKGKKASGGNSTAIGGFATEREKDINVKREIISGKEIFQQHDENMTKDIIDNMPTINRFYQSSGINRKAGSFNE
jgi:hypothetical protein